MLSNALAGEAYSPTLPLSIYGLLFSTTSHFLPRLVLDVGSFTARAWKIDIAGVLFGVGMAIAAVNFMAWLFP